MENTLMQPTDVTAKASEIKQEKKAKKQKSIIPLSDVLAQNFKTIKLEGEWYEAFGEPQDKGVWLVWGSSGGGKSYFVMQLAKELAKTKKVLYNVLEEETDDTDFINRVKNVGMNDVKDKFKMQRHGYEDLVNFLKKAKKSYNPEVIIIDSLPYFIKTFDQYMKLKKQFPSKIFIFTAHAKGANPRSELETRVQYDAKMKIFVNGYLASCKGRTIGPNGGHFISWKEGYEKVRGSIEK
ncbi:MULTISPECIES: P-loop NTPase family protein [Flavobacterium]|uniref:ATP-binding protein n=1 Tax=Flavobacterium TaxID=237 RepID=UPI000B4CDFB6|nr:MULTISPECIES: ATP-binding protein [Flavobacterium]